MQTCGLCEDCQCDDDCNCIEARPRELDRCNKCGIFCECNEYCDCAPDRCEICNFCECHPDTCFCKDLCALCDHCDCDENCNCITNSTTPALSLSNSTPSPVSDTESAQSDAPVGLSAQAPETKISPVVNSSASTTSLTGASTEKPSREALSVGFIVGLSFGAIVVMLLVGAAGYLFGWQVRENQGPSETNKKAQSGIHEDGHEDLHAPRESVNPSTAGTSSVGVHQPPPSSNDDESHDNTNPFTSDQQPESTAVEKSVEAPRILEFKDQCSPIGPSRDAANSTPGSHDLSSLTSNAILPESEQSAQNNESSVASVVAMAVDITGDNTANEREETSAISTANQEPQTGSQ